jgi:hypothetical protein
MGSSCDRAPTKTCSGTGWASWYSPWLYSNEGTSPELHLVAQNGPGHWRLSREMSGMSGEYISTVSPFSPLAVAYSTLESSSSLSLWDHTWDTHISSPLNFMHIRSGLMHTISISSEKTTETLKSVFATRRIPHGHSWMAFQAFPLVLSSTVWTACSAYP